MTASRRSSTETNSRRNEPRSLLTSSPVGLRNRGAPHEHPLSPIHSMVDVVNDSELGRSPRNKFRSAVRKIIMMQRLATASAYVGAEPGVDPRRAAAHMAYRHVQQRSLIEVVDYSSVRCTSEQMSNEDFVKMLSNDSRPVREPWVKVRWINVGGVSWDVISALALKYDLHPLAVENILQTRKHARSKADYYPQHLFLRVLCHTLVPESPEDPGRDLYSFPSVEVPRAGSPIPLSSDAEIGVSEQGRYDKTAFPSKPNDIFGLGGIFRERLGRPIHPTANSMLTRGPFQRTSTFNMDIKSRKDARNFKVIQELLKGQRVNVKVAPMCIFLFRDGTVISIHHDRNLSCTAPIMGRLQHNDSSLRSTTDASLLVQGLLDLVVDLAMEVTREYQSRILKLERAVLLRPEMKHVVRLHALQEDLILHRRTLSPIKTLVYSLRRYDVDRAAALSDALDSSKTIEGFMSHKARVYLADVYDHMEYILANLDMFAGVSENLIDYTFNMSSYEMSVVMRRLTLATVIFSPLTVLAGYFGMNFEEMWTTHHDHSDVIYWAIALPMLAILLPIFLWSDLSKMKESFEKRMVARSVKRQYLST